MQLRFHVRIAAVVLCAGIGHAQVDTHGAPVTATNAVGGTLVLSMERCLELALGANLTLALGRLVPEARGEDFYIAGETFTPVIFADGQYSERESPTESTQEGADVLVQETLAWNAGVRKTWTSGTRLALSWASSRREDNSEFRTLNPAHDVQPVLAVTQPLLRGFGLAVNRADLERALLDRELADSDFAVLLESELLAIYRAYWDLSRSASLFALDEASRRLAAYQVSIVSNRLAVGAAAALDLVSAEAALARQQEAVIAARNAYRKAGDALLLRIRPSAQVADYDLAIIPSTEPVPPAETAVPALVDSAAVALAQRPELRGGELGILRAGLDVTVAKNARLPELNAFGRYGYSGVAGSEGDATDDVWDRTYPEWTAGLSLEFFFDNESRRARWRQAVLSRQSAELRQQQAQAEVVSEVRAATFDLQTAIERRAATARTLALARQQYEGELERLRVGDSTLFQVDTFRRDQLAAERNHVDAGIDYFVAQAVLAAARGEFAQKLVAAAGGEGED